MRPIVPAKDSQTSQRFYAELGFRPTPLTPDLVEMTLGPFPFLLQNDYVQQWADNFAMHMPVSDVNLWWNHIKSLNLPARSPATVRPPKPEPWGTVAIVIDPSGVLCRVSQP